LVFLDGNGQLHSAKGMFQQVLREVVDHVDGGIAGILMGYDGIAVDSYARLADAEVEAVGLEYGALLPGLQRAAGMLQAGSMQEVELRTNQLTTVIYLLNEEYFVAVTLRAFGNAGKARFLLRLASERLMAGLR